MDQRDFVILTCGAFVLDCGGVWLVEIRSGHFAIMQILEFLAMVGVVDGVAFEGSVSIGVIRFEDLFLKDFVVRARVHTSSGVDDHWELTFNALEIIVVISLVRKTIRVELSQITG